MCLLRLALCVPAVSFTGFAVLGELCANVFLFLTDDSFHAKLAKDRKARKGHIGATSFSYSIVVDP
jgi:hypothetical protein